MAIVGAISEMSATRLSVWFAAVLFVATTLVDSQVTWTPIYVGTYSEYPFPSCFRPSLTFHQSRVYRKSRLMKLDGSFFIARCTLSITGEGEKEEKSKIDFISIRN